MSAAQRKCFVNPLLGCGPILQYLKWINSLINTNNKEENILTIPTNMVPIARKGIGKLHLKRFEDIHWLNFKLAYEFLTDIRIT